MVAYRSHTSTAGTATSVTINKPASVANGDLLLGFIHKNANSEVIVPPAGWTTLREGNPADWYPDISGISLGRVWFGWKIADNEGASWQWTWALSRAHRGVVVAYTGAHPTDPICGGDTFIENGSTAYSFPDVWDGYGSTLSVLLGTTLSVIGNHTPPSGFTERVDDTATTSMYVAERANGASPGAVTGGSTSTGTSADRLEVHLVLRDATAAPAQPRLRGWVHNGGQSIGDLVTLMRPLSAVEGTTLLAFWSAGSGSVGPNQAVPPAGWTQVGADIFADASSEDMWAEVWMKVMTDSEPDSYDWTGTGSSTEDWAISMLCFDYLGDPVIQATGATGMGTAVTLAAVTSPRDNSLLLAMLASEPDSDFTTPSGMTFLYKATGVGKTISNQEVSIQEVDAGSMGVRTSTLSSSGGWLGALVVIPRGNFVPTAPTLLTPDNLATIPGDDAPFTWEHNDPEPDPQGHYAFRRKKLPL